MGVELIHAICCDPIEQAVRIIAEAAIFWAGV